MSEKIARVTIDKNGNLKPASPEIRRMAREIIEKSGANSSEHFKKVVVGAMTFKERAETWLVEVRSRKFGAYRETTAETPSYASGC
jgi:hypothetical protein